MKENTRLKILALGERRTHLVQELRTRPRGIAWCGEHTEIADAIATLLFDDLAQDHGIDAELALIATGGFGRRELCPKSDIDLTVVPKDQFSSELDAIIRRLFQEIHWAYGTVLRLDVGYAYRLISDAPGLDVKTRTGLLDMRLLGGSRDLYRELENALQDSFDAGEFVLAKIEERLQAYARYNDTPLVVEPHIKEGAGGIRDFHCANWIGEAIGERASRPTPAYDAVLKYRNLLHFQAGKTQDLLSRTRRSELAQLIGMSPGEISSELADAALELHAGFLRTRGKLFESRFALAPGAIAVGGEVRILPDAAIGDAAVGVAIATRLGLTVSDLPATACSAQGSPSAAYAISTGEKTLRNLDRCSLLGQLLPELDKCRTLAPDDGFHTFTVMEHSLRAVRLLDMLAPGTFLGDIKDAVTDLEPLYLATLLHDVGKQFPERDHSLVGATIGREICRRWSLSETVEEHVGWLIEHHLTMARFIRIRDLMHPNTIEEFVQIVKDSERLKMLTLLTWADVNAVAQGAWTTAQETFLKQLYDRAFTRIQGPTQPPPDPSQSRQRLLRQLKKHDDDERRHQEFLDSLPVYYLASTPAEVVHLHMELASRAASGVPTIEHFGRPDLSGSEITVCSLDSPGLLSRLLGVLYAYDMTLQSIRACTTSTEPHVAVDVFTVSFSGRPVPPATMGQVSASLLEVAQGIKTVDEILSAAGKEPTRPQHIFNYSFVQGLPGILEIRAPRGRGMAFRMSRLIAARGWNILAARVGQWGGNAAAAFYVTDSLGAEIEAAHIEEAMSESLES